MHRALLFLLITTLALGGCLFQTPPAAPKTVSGDDRLLLAGLRELSENRPPTSLETLVANHPSSHQSELASQLLAWKQQHPQLPAEGRKSPESELRELREENRRLRGDLEQLRQLLIDTERRSR